VQCPLKAETVTIGALHPKLLKPWIVFEFHHHRFFSFSDVNEMRIRKWQGQTAEKTYFPLR
jgi:hypothetical protein